MAEKLPALLRAQQAARAVEKRGKNKDQGYDYVLAADVIDAAQNALHEAGLVAMMSYTEADERPIKSKSGTDGVYVMLKSELIIFDPEHGELTKVHGFGAGIDYPGDKAVYKAMTGATKYAYAAALGIPFGDDPEDTAQAHPEAREAAGERPKGFASDKQANMLKRCLRERNAKDPENIAAWLEASFDGSRGGGISRAIDRLMDKSDETVVDDLQSLAAAWHAEQPATENVVPDDEDLPQLDDIARD